MARHSRLKSATNWYHVILRGINKQNIFEDDQDRKYFIEVLNIVKDISKMRLYCYCLMSNHAHLLVETGQEELGESMKRIAARYVFRFNMRYERCGHLFSGAVQK
jgi:REP element-mobilizing transposase RayT